jgi:hypothetical protein
MIPALAGQGKKYRKCHGNQLTNPQKSAAQMATPATTTSFEDALEAMYHGPFALDEQGFGEIDTSLPQLADDLQSYDRVSALIAMGALAVVAEIQIHVVRLDCLLHLIGIHSSDWVTFHNLHLYLLRRKYPEVGCWPNGRGCFTTICNAI